MPQALLALGTVDPEGIRRFLLFPHTLSAYSLRESRPGRVVLELLGTQEELIPAFRADIQTFLEVVSVLLTSPAAESHALA